MGHGVCARGKGGGGGYFDYDIGQRLMPQSWRCSMTLFSTT